ncbi:type 2 lanthipeptide synthetase LanM family protein [Bacillus cereus]
MTVMIQTVDKRLIYALTIEERAKETSYVHEPTAWETWQSRKSLLKQADVEFMLNHYKDEQSFKKGIQPVAEHDVESMLLKVERSEWYKLFNEVFATYEENERPATYDYTYAIRFFLQYMKRFLKEELDTSTHYKFHIDAVVSIVQGYSEELIGFMSRTFAHDIQVMKETHGLIGETGESRFADYMQRRFENVEKAKEFFYDYPALLRLIAVKTIFFKHNISEFIKRLNDNAYEITEKLGHSSRTIQRIGLSAGDSHNQGKSVMIVYFSEHELLVYKPKDLQYTKKLETFFNFLNETLGTDFYSVQRIIREDYAFEKFIERQPCESEEDLRGFYRRYGELIGLAYILRGTDFHYENIIAYGNRPVLIDVETFLQQHVPLEFGKSAHVTAKERQLDSVVLTGLVPFHILADRSENKQQGINISGLSYGTQKAPFKILKLNNHSTDEMKFEYMEHYISGKNNTPLLNGEEVPYEAYREDILVGFENFMKKCITHRHVIIEQVQMLFVDSRVRNVVRPTQRYVDLLQFSYHPTCMQNMIEREKVLHNLFAYPYRDKRIAIFELQEMLEGDVPQFFNRTSQRHLLNNNDIEIKEIYKESIVDQIVTSLMHLAPKQIEEQRLQMEMAMGIYNHTEHVPEQSNAVIQKDVLVVVKEAARKLLKEAVYDEKTHSMTWIDILCKTDWKYEAMNNQLYDGLPGMYAFFSALQATDKQRDIDYVDVKKRILNTMLVIPSVPKASAFYGNGALIYPLLLDAQLNNNEEALSLACQIANQVMTFEVEKSNDWLTGQTSLIAVFKQLADVTKNPTYNNYALTLSKQLTYDKELPYVGFIHGNSSAYYVKALMDKQSPSIYEWIREEDTHWNENHWRDPRPDKPNCVHAVCHGSTGILLNRIMVEELTHKEVGVKQRLQIMNNLFNQKKEDSICHGTAGDIELLLTLQAHDIGTYQPLLQQKMSQLLANYYEYGAFRLQGYETIQSKGMYTGVTGVLYTLLRTLNPTLPSFVLLQLPTRKDG